MTSKEITNLLTYLVPLLWPLITYLLDRLRKRGETTETPEPQVPQARPKIVIPIPRPAPSPSDFETTPDTTANDGDAQDAALSPTTWDADNAEDGEDADDKVLPENTDSPTLPADEFIAAASQTPSASPLAATTPARPMPRTQRAIHIRESLILHTILSPPRGKGMRRSATRF